MKLRLERKHPYRLQIVERETVTHELILGSIGLVHALKGLLGFTPFCTEGNAGGVYDGRDSKWVVWCDADEEQVKGFPVFHVGEDGRIVDEENVPLVNDEQLRTIAQLLHPRRSPHPNAAAPDEKPTDDAEDHHREEQRTEDHENFDTEDRPKSTQYDLDDDGDDFEEDADDDSDTDEDQFDELYRMVETIDWFSLYHDRRSRKLRRGAEVVLDSDLPMPDEVAIARLLPSDMFGPLPLLDNLTWIDRLGPLTGESRRQWTSRFLNVMQRFGINTDMLTHLANVYPAPAE